jgi:hypothetical protein
MCFEMKNILKSNRYHTPKYIKIIQVPKFARFKKRVRWWWWWWWSREMVNGSFVRGSEMI